MRSQDRGLECEQKVVTDLKSRGWKLLHWRLKTPFAEVDLVFLDRDMRQCVVEVKSDFHSGFSEFRLGPRQRQRLIRAREYLQESSGRETYLRLALVQNQQIQYLELY